MLDYNRAMKEPRLLHYRRFANAAFSMIELLAVVAILAILTTLYLSKMNLSSQRDRGLESCRQNLERIYLAMDIYSRDNHSQYPAATNALAPDDALALLVPHYTSDTSIFICPVSGKTPPPPGKSVRDWTTSYAYYMGRRSSDPNAVVMSDGQVDSRPKGKGDTVFSETGKPPGNNHGKKGGNLMMCDGSVIQTDGNAPFSLQFTPPVVLLNPTP